MADKFTAYADTVDAPGTIAAAVVPSDSTDLTDIPKAIYVGTSGNIAMIGTGASTASTGVVWKNIPAGTVLPFRPRRILATGTTAADIVAIY